MRIMRWFLRMNGVFHGDRWERWAFEAERVVQRFESKWNILETEALDDDAVWDTLVCWLEKNQERLVNSAQKVWTACQ